MKTKGSLTSQERLEQLGYTQQLQRTLNTKDNIVLTMATVSPLMAVFVLALSAIRLAGTASIWGMILFSVIAVCNGLVLGELICEYPVSGGMYSFAKFTLPKSLSGVVGISIAVQSVLATSSIALGVATYIQLMLPILETYHIGLKHIVVIVLLLSFCVCIRNINAGKNVATLLLSVQLLIMLAFVITCLLKSERSLGELLSNLVVLSDGGLKKVGLETVVISIAPVFFTINGYDSSLGLAEETIGESKNVSKSVLISAIGAAALITLTVLASALAAPDLYEYLNAVSPFLYTTHAIWGTAGEWIMNLGVQIASLGALFSLITYYSRVLYAMGRDQLFVQPINQVLSRVSSKENTPVIATGVIVGFAVIVSCTVPLERTVELVGVLAAAVYMFTAIGSIRNRQIHKGIQRVVSMPLFPLPAILVILTALLVLSAQTRTTQAALLVLAGIGLWLGHRQNRQT